MALLGKDQHKFDPVDKEERYIILNKESRYNIESELCCRIIPLPGHTEDSIGIMFNNRDFFCGDAAMNGFPSTNRVTIWIENIDDYEQSWDQIVKLNPRTLYPSHGKPFNVIDLIKNKKWIKNKKLYPLKE